MFTLIYQWTESGASVYAIVIGMGMPAGNYDVDVWIRVKVSKTVYAANRTEAFAKVLKECERIDGYEDVLKNKVVGEWEPEALAKRASRQSR